ncbi:MAG: ADP-ribosylglycohydrolase family protein [Oscillospiraceae bacterium]|nr:ADP-ribosylglycohydrolase family protein [Oscillospiraceae bacterium]
MSFIENFKGDPDRFRGCIIAGAAGDALGYAVEFDRLHSILKYFGPDGITGYELTGDEAVFSDDTQMTLYTLDGLLHGKADGDYIGAIDRNYQDWLITQNGHGEPSRGKQSILNEFPELNHPRAPGNTCLSALRSPVRGSVKEPVNHSKGCGGVMRVAPCGLYFKDIEKAAKIAAEAAALTHGHELGWMPAALMAAMVNLAAWTDLPFYNLVDEAVAVVNRLWPGAEHLPALNALIEKTVDLSMSSESDRDAIRLLGEGWVGDEALAIALFCVLRHPDDLKDCLIAAVNHDGDSDSTGSIAGNILGARLGLSALPAEFRDKLELEEVLYGLAGKLCRYAEI